MLNSYSFIRARKKHFFKKLIKVWIGYNIVSVALMLVVTLLLSYKISQMNDMEKEYDQKRAELIKEIEESDKKLALMKKEKSFATDVYSQNELLKESVKNLFELVPDQITLNSVEMEHDMLVLKGMTPSKEIYNFLLSVPLKSIFTYSKADFYMTQNGWYNFVSVNRLEEQKVEEETKE